MSTSTPEPLDPSFQITLPAFEGPLDLLLHLIRKHELDILDLPIAFVTERYLAYVSMMEHLNLDIASEYLVMAATLAHIKSKMLLPQEPEDQPDEESAEEEIDPRAELIRRLLEYQKYKAAAEQLGSRGIAGRDVFLRGSDAPEAIGPAPLAGISLFKLLDAFSAVLKRAEGDLAFEITAEGVSIQDRMRQLTELLSQRREVTFDELFEGQVTIYDLVITFMALLEMAKRRLVRIYQADPHSPIHLQSTVLADTEPAETPAETVDADDERPAAESAEAEGASEEDWESAGEDWQSSEAFAEAAERLDASPESTADAWTESEAELDEVEPVEDEVGSDASSRLSEEWDTEPATEVAPETELGGEPETEGELASEPVEDEGSSTATEVAPETELGGEPETVVAPAEELDDVAMFASEPVEELVEDEASSTLADERDPVMEVGATELGGEPETVAGSVEVSTSASEPVEDDERDTGTEVAPIEAAEFDAADAPEVELAEPVSRPEDEPGTQGEEPEAPSDPVSVAGDGLEKLDPTNGSGMESAPIESVRDDEDAPT